uniref:Hypothetical secreted peptide n=1 Tax=Glossina morsitans morsitans TaxID=37546 RepID=D3TSI5_GLOMM
MYVNCLCFFLLLLKHFLTEIIYNGNENDLVRDSFAHEYVVPRYILNEKEKFIYFIYVY